MIVKCDNCKKVQEIKRDFEICYNCNHILNFEVEK